jgi:glycosyltransferase involved in cell wall biosynthesis
VRREALTLIDMGYRVRLLAWDRDGKSPKEEILEGVEVERVRLSSTHGRGTVQLFFYLVLYLRIFWRGWKVPFQVVHCHDLDTLPIGFLLGKLKRKPIIYDSHECFLEMFQGRVHPWVIRILETLENWMLRRVDLLITVGEKLRQHFIERGARHTVVVGNWKALEEYTRTPEENAALRRSLGIPAGAIMVTCITQLLKNRMIEELVNAAKPYSDVYTVLAGKGELEPAVRKWAENNPRLIHLGFIHASAVPSYTCASDVIYCGFDPAMPNFRFAAPNKLFEALAAGKPLITPNVGEIGDMVRNANCGVVMQDCGAESIGQAIDAMRDTTQRMAWTQNAEQLGRMEMNWNKGREVLGQEYSKLAPRRAGSFSIKAENACLSVAARSAAASTSRLSGPEEKY